MSDEGETKELVFATTKQHLQFGEFCDACRKYRYIGICHGVPGAGKTRSAREYASWDVLSSLFPEELFTLAGRRQANDQFPHKPFATPGSPDFTEVLPCRTLYYTAPVTATPSRIEREVMALSATLSYLVEAAEQASRGKMIFYWPIASPNEQSSRLLMKPSASNQRGWSRSMTSITEENLA